jgi:hypothetical protein
MGKILSDYAADQSHIWLSRAFLYVLLRKILQQLVNPEEKLVISFE